MQPSEQAVRRYIDAWFEPDRERRAQLLEACFAVDGRITIGERVIRGRSELAAMIDVFQVDPRRLSARLTSPIDAGGTTFRFSALFTLPDGRRHSELIDFGEVDGDGRIAKLFTFEEPLAEGAAPPNAASPAAQAAMRYIDVWTERDPVARRARLEACFAAAAGWSRGGAASAAWPSWRRWSRTRSPIRAGYPRSGRRRSRPRAPPFASARSVHSPTAVRRSWGRTSARSTTMAGSR